jgi:hypothetical protein
MERPESPTLFALSLIGGFTLMTAIAVYCHLLARRIILGSSRRALKIFVSPLIFVFVVAVFICLPGGLAAFYSAHYGYQLQPDETPGPLGNIGGFIAVLLWLLGFVSLLAYAVYLLILSLRVWLSDYPD